MKTQDIDIIFISYDEPNAEFNWAMIKNQAPWAKRVHGVKGSDNAHKAAAELSSTDWFVTVDGDNIVDPKFFSIELELVPEIQVYGWSGKNIINNLRYGNGGLKIWNKQFVLDMKTHEAADTERAQVDFCWETGYRNFPTVFSTTVINSSPYQAWRAGFREGVKMLLKDGLKVSIDKIDKEIYWHNIHRLKIWASVGTHVENGIYAMLGARSGSFMTYCLDGWDYTQVRDFSYLENLYNAEFKKYESDYDLLMKKLESLAFDLRAELGLNTATFDPTQSEYILRLYDETVAMGQTYYNKDPVWKSIS